MKRDQLAFLIGGIVFGVLLGYGLFHAIENRPGAATAQTAEEVPSPQGPMAATQSGSMGGAPGVGGAETMGGPSAGGAPMMAEINALKSAFQVNPKNKAAVVRLGNIYHDVGQWQQAIDFYQQAIDIDPKDADVLTDQGICYQQMGVFDKSLDCFRRAQAVSPSHWQSLYNMAIVTGFSLGRPAEAKQLLDRLEKINPQAPNLAAMQKALDDAMRAKGGSPS